MDWGALSTWTRGTWGVGGWQDGQQDAPGPAVCPSERIQLACGWCGPTSRVSLGCGQWVVTSPPWRWRLSKETVGSPTPLRSPSAPVLGLSPSAQDPKIPWHHSRSWGGARPRSRVQVFLREARLVVEGKEEAFPGCNGVAGSVDECTKGDP